MRDRTATLNRLKNPHDQSAAAPRRHRLPQIEAQIISLAAPTDARDGRCAPVPAPGRAGQYSGTGNGHGSSPFLREYEGAGSVFDRTDKM